jgi:hypothetical protein
MADEIGVNEELEVGALAPEVGEEALPEEELVERAGTIMSHTVEEIPELEGAGVGDAINMVVRNITDEGIFELEVQPIAPPEPEALPPEAGIGGEELTETLI